MPRRTTDPAAIARAERDADAVRLRREGKSYREIAETCKFNSEQAAHKAVATALKRTVSDEVAQMRQIDNLRLDRLQDTYGERAETGDEKAAGIILGVMHRRAKLNGLDMPTKIAETDTLGRDKPADVKIYLPANSRDESQP